MERVSRGFYFGACVLFLAVMWASSANLLLDSTAAAIAGIGTTVALLVLAASVWRSGFRRDVAIVVAVVAAATALICGLGRVGFRADGAGWWVTVVLALPLLYVLLGLPDWRGALLAAAVVVVAVVGRWVVDPRHPALAVVEILGACAAAIATAQAAGLLRRVGEVNDARERRQVIQLTAEARSVGKEAHTRWVDRFLHDEVAHALRAVTLSERLDRAEVRSIAAEAADRLADLSVTDPPTVDLGGVLSDVAAESGLTVDLDLASVTVAPDVVDVVAAVVREALRNVRRHAGVGEARVVLRDVGNAVVVDVIDQGRGFKPAQVPRDRFGVRDGIVARMGDIAGTASITSGATGTRVRLQWASQTSEDTDWVDQVRARRVAVLISGPFVVACVLQCALRAGELQHPWAGVLGTVLVVLAWCFGAWAYRQRDIGWRMNLVMVAIACTAIGLNAYALPAGASDPTLFWLASSAMPLTAFSVVGRSLLECAIAVLVIATLPVALLVVTGSSLNQILGLAGALFAPFALAPLILGGAWWTERGVRRALQDNDIRQHSVVRQVEADLREQALRDRVGDLRARIQPFLADVASPDSDPRDDAVRRRAAVLEAWVRDGLGGPTTQWPADLTAPVHSLRESGAQVTLSQVAPMPSEHMAFVTQVLAALRNCAPARIGVSSTAGPDGTRTTVTVRPVDQEACEQISALGVGSVRTDGSTYLVVQFDSAQVSGVPRTVPGASGSAMIGP
ncbi:signal transduction histidine kinase [Branchiibius hedensis]|uniref:Signal transduction histidine kinase n=2 Tax=Branchiibius hedensis TaxID=672460 RepID=A0A2Y8ZNR5_9MICO|nr:signal transduction histidine kinase [Branchiibius hedensis]SSA33006.1 Signal transduction histidine kinase [Branchiibius hedensis]